MNNKIEWKSNINIKDGFDIVIGNPPYKILTKNNVPSTELKLLTNKYQSVKGSYSKNIFILFIENSISLLKKYSILSFIVPEGLFTTKSYSGCVELMGKNGFVKSIATFSNYVFENAVTGNLIFVFDKGKKGETDNFHFNENFKIAKTIQKENILLSKIKNETKSLIQISSLFKGMVVKDREKVISKIKNEKKDIFLLGKNISKWNIKSEFYTNYEDLEIIGGTKKIEKHNQNPRILIRRTGDTLCCSFLNKKALTESTLYSCWSTSEKFSNEFLLSILNSKLLDYYNKSLNITNQQGFPQILMFDLELLPIKEIPLTNQAPFTAIVNQILEKKKLGEDTQELENEIDQMVYKLYELTQEEIDIVEKNINN